jgi:hypothetical protein
MQRGAGDRTQGIRQFLDFDANWLTGNRSSLTIVSGPIQFSPGSELMRIRSRIEMMMRPSVIVVGALCGVGALASLFIVLVRLPAMASSKLELLFGTLLGTAVGLLFAIAALMTNLTYLVHRANRQRISN